MHTVCTASRTTIIPQVATLVSNMAPGSLSVQARRQSAISGHDAIITPHYLHLVLDLGHATLLFTPREGPSAKWQYSYTKPLQVVCSCIPLVLLMAHEEGE